jgi:Response regulator containing CheY-like receiver, AAA-type ATPase, and DNA-binding domains
MSPPAHGHTDGRRIIVTDDQPNRLETLTSTLREAGHCVFAVRNGQSALELLAVLPNIDLLITNTRLGIVDGAMLISQTRRLRPDLPILHVSDKTSEHITPPGVPTLSEPFTPNELLHAVRHLLG